MYASNNWLRSCFLKKITVMTTIVFHSKRLVADASVHNTINFVCYNFY